MKNKKMTDSSTKRVLEHEGAKEQEVFSDRIYRMIRIWAVEGASRESRGDSLWIKTASAFVVRAPAGQIRLDPATLSPCEALTWHLVVRI